jgi:hypothetical protein
MDGAGRFRGVESLGSSEEWNGRVQTKETEAMSLQPEGLEPIPEQTACLATEVFRTPTAAMVLRDVPFASLSPLTS